MKRLLPVFNHTKNVNRFIQPLSFSMNRQIGTKQHLFVGTKSSEFAVNKLVCILDDDDDMNNMCLHFVRLSLL